MSGVRYEHAPLDWRAKGLPAIEGTLDVADVIGSGWNLFDGRSLLPTMVLRRDALEHDIALMASWARDVGLSLAPHGKTTMSPQIWQRQLDAGAWAITVANAWQARVAATVGVPRILVANQIVDEAGMAWLASVLEQGGPEVITQVDSVAGVERLDAALGRGRSRLRVLLEVGVRNGRAGVRTLEEAHRLLAAVVGSGRLAIAGVTCFEGIVPGASADRKREGVLELLATVREVAAFVSPAGAAQGGSEIILSGGGSIHFLTVAEELSRPLGGTHLPVRVVIRSGCTVTHDHAGYDLESPWGSTAPPGSPRLQPALEVWAPVLSTPEPGLALAGAGRRDLPYDVALPAVIAVRRSGGVAEARGMTVTGLNDQHAYIRLESGVELAVGDLVGFGIAHPCSAFDRWRQIPVVDPAYDIVDVVETIF